MFVSTVNLQVNFNVFNHTVYDGPGLVRELTHTVSGHYLDQTLTNYVARLNVACDRLSGRQTTSDHVDSGSWKTEKIRVLVARTVLDAIVTSLFGQTSDTEFDTQTVFESFEIFHRSMPETV